MNVIVIGGGWAGLAASVELARQGVSVTMLESARQLGGRARTVRFGERRIDNGQHLLLGAYRTVLSLLATVGIAEGEVFRRLPLRLQLQDADRVGFTLAAPRLPAPLHTLWALAVARGLVTRERFAAARLMAAARRPPKEDIALLEFMRRLHQPDTVIRALWQPLCLAALNTPVAEASTLLFLAVLRAAFLARRRASDLLLPIVDLGRCLPEPARDFIEQHQGSVRLGMRVKGLQVDDDVVTGVHIDHVTLSADAVIIATGPKAAADLLRPHDALTAAAMNLDCLGHSPIATLYLQYPASVRLPEPFLGLLDCEVQWLFDRRLAGCPGMIAAVISGPGPHARLDATALTARMQTEIARRFPAWPAPLTAKLIREKHATFAAVAGCDKFRPGNATDVQGLWLAGDYTDTGYPGTLEGATLSGVQCARLILERHSQYDERLSTAT